MVAGHRVEKVVPLHRRLEQHALIAAVDVGQEIDCWKRESLSAFGSTEVAINRIDLPSGDMTTGIRLRAGQLPVVGQLGIALGQRRGGQQ